MIRFRTSDTPAYAWVIQGAIIGSLIGAAFANHPAWFLAAAIDLGTVLALWTFEWRPVAIEAEKDGA